MKRNGAFSCTLLYQKLYKKSVFSRFNAIFISYKQTLSIPQIRNIFSKVESKLLDILAFLEKKFGILDELEIDVEAKTDEEVKDIINHIYYIIFNDYSVEIGDNNRIKDSKIYSQIVGNGVRDK